MPDSMDGAYQQGTASRSENSPQLFLEVSPPAYLFQTGLEEIHENDHGDGAGLAKHLLQEGRFRQRAACQAGDPDGHPVESWPECQDDQQPGGAYSAQIKDTLPEIVRIFFFPVQVVKDNSSQAGAKGTHQD